MQHSEPTFLMLGYFPTEIESHDQDANRWAMERSEPSDETGAHSYRSLLEEGDARPQALPCFTQGWIEVDSNEPAMRIRSYGTRSNTRDDHAASDLVSQMGVRDAAPNLGDLSLHVCASEESYPRLTSKCSALGDIGADQHLRLSSGESFDSTEEDDWVVVESTSPRQLTSSPSFVLDTEEVEDRPTSPTSERGEGVYASCFDVQRSMEDQTPHQVLEQDTKRSVNPGREHADVTAVSAEETRYDSHSTNSFSAEQPPVDTVATARASRRIAAYGTARVASRLSSRERKRAVATHASHMTTHSSNFHGSKQMQPPALAEFLKVIEEFGTCQWLEQLLKMLGCLSSGPPVVLAGLPLFADF